jgi:hypothetical protein
MARELTGEYVLSLLQELEQEARLTYKVQILFRHGLSKSDAWKLLIQHLPKFEAGTFKASWRAWERSNGRTPLGDYV